MFFELMKISKGRRCSYLVPALSTMSLMVTYRACSNSGDLTLKVEPTRVSGRSTLSCIWITSACLGAAGVACFALPAASATLSSGLTTL